MGSRTNVVISFKSTAGKPTLATVLMDQPIVLYSHWGGSETPFALAEALANSRTRWEDGPYLARILVSQIVANNWDQETGYGLHVGEIGDNEYPVLVVDIPRKLVLRFGEPGDNMTPDRAGGAIDTAEWTFRQFADFDEDQAAEAVHGKN